MNPHSVTKDFEQALADYTGAPFVVCVDNCSNALFLALMYEIVKGKEIIIPANTYPAVPCEVIHAGGKVKFRESTSNTLKGMYQLCPSRVWDSALSFYHGMYMSNTLMCLSFTGGFKHLKLGKGGAILTDDPKAAAWFKRARFSGRNECSYHEDFFDTLGWNFYMPNDTAARGLLLMSGFYDVKGNPISYPDKELEYPDLSRFPIYTNEKYTNYW